jgi:hypothetical protein
LESRSGEVSRVWEKVGLTHKLSDSAMLDIRIRDRRASDENAERFQWEEKPGLGRFGFQDAVQGSYARFAHRLQGNVARFIECASLEIRIEKLPGEVSKSVHEHDRRSTGPQVVP